MTSRLPESPAALLSKIETDLSVLKWMVGAMLVGVVVLLLKTFS